MKTEEWRDIPGFEGRYQVSDMGNVIAVGRHSVKNYKGKEHTFYVKQHEMARSKLSRGYVGVGLRNSDRGVTTPLHRAVATAFIPNPHNLPQVNHIDGDKTNNVVSNLEWVDNKGNHEHAARLDLKAYGERNGNHKLTTDEARQIKILLVSQGTTYADIGARFGVSRATVSMIATGRSWRRA